jgi:hypothetical protein
VCISKRDVKFVSEEGTNMEKHEGRERRAKYEGKSVRTDKFRVPK